MTLHDGRATVDDEIAVVLLDQARPEFLGGQFVHSVVASLDWDGMLTFFRTGQPIAERPDRYRASIERLTVQDIAVFFGEALAELPQLVADLSRGGRVVDVHCGGARWLIAMARRFPALELVGVEFQPDSVLRARANVEAAGLTDRIEIHQAAVTKPDKVAAYDLAYFQYALHQLADPVASLRAAWAALRPGGRIIVLDWPLPSNLDEFRTRHGELIAGRPARRAVPGHGPRDPRTVRRLVRRGGAAGAGPHRPAVGRLAARGRTPRLTRVSRRADRRRRALGHSVTVIVPVIDEWIAQWNG